MKFSPEEMSAIEDMLKSQDPRVREALDYGLQKSLEDLKKLNKAMYLSERVEFLVNRAGFELLAAKNLQGYKGAYVIMFFDGDNFKRVNDTQGQTFGDEAIKEMGGAVAGASRLLNQRR